MTLLTAIEKFRVLLHEAAVGGDVVITLDPPDYFDVQKEHGVPNDAAQFFLRIGNVANDDRRLIVRTRG